MKQQTASSSVFQTYTNLHRLQVHLLLAWSFEQAQHRVNTVDEEEISDILYQEIQRLLMIEEAKWMANYAVKNEDPISGVKRSGKRRREIDLIIEMTVRGRPQYVFEAKALNSEKSYQNGKNYVDHSGMGRFIEGEYADYASRFPEIGMLGYVLTDTVKDWQQRLKQAIDDRKHELGLRCAQQDVVICKAIAHEWVSEHDRISSDRPVAIYHILLDFC